MSRLQEVRSTVPFKSNWKAICLTCHFISSCPFCTLGVCIQKQGANPCSSVWICPKAVLRGHSGPASIGSPGCAPSETHVGMAASLTDHLLHPILCIQNAFPFGLTEICEGSLIYRSEKLGSLVWGVSLVPRTEQADTMLRQRNSPHKLAESRNSTFQQQRGNQEKRCWSPKSFQFLAK